MFLTTKFSKERTPKNPYGRQIYENAYLSITFDCEQLFLMKFYSKIKNKGTLFVRHFQVFAPPPYTVGLFRNLITINLVLGHAPIFYSSSFFPKAEIKKNPIC